MPAGCGEPNSSRPLTAGRPGPAVRGGDAAPRCTWQKAELSDYMFTVFGAVTSACALTPSGDRKCRGSALGRAMGRLGMHPAFAPVDQPTTLTFSAWGPFWPWVMSNSTFCPSSRLR